MNIEDYKSIQQIIMRLRFILERIEIEDDNYAPLKSAISYLSFIEN